MAKWFVMLLVLISMGCMGPEKRAEKEALAQWKAAVQPILQAKPTDENAGTVALAAAKPKLQEIAAKNPKNEAGAQALRSLIMYASDEAERDGYIKTLRERFPAHPAVKEIEAVQEVVTLMEPVKAAATEQEGTKKFAEAKPKLKVIADKNPRNEAGKMALVILMMNSCEDEKEQAVYAKRLGEQFPDDSFVKMILGEDGGDGGPTACDVAGAEAKDFSSPDLSGKMMKLSDYKGKVVLIDFFAAWCGPCRAAMPQLLKTYEKYHAMGLEVIGVSLDNTADEAKKYVAEVGAKWPVAFQLPGGWNTPVAKLYGIQAIPAMLLIGKDGKIIGQAEPGKELDAMIEKALAGEKAPPKAAPAKTPKKK